MPPNLLLVVFDTARADSFDPYGAPAGSTPVVADLARRGAALPRVYSTANWTLPAHASMFTGLLPRTLGLGRGTDPRDLLAPFAGRTLAEVLRRAGYATSAVSANLWIARRHGFSTGFERFRSVRGSRRHHVGAGIRGRLRWEFEAIRARADDGLRSVDAVIRRWIDARPTQPFFWFANLMECHSPYLPPRPYNDLPLHRRWLAGRDARRYQSHGGFLRVSLGELDIDPAAEERMRHLYRRSVRSMDDWIGATLERLDRAGLLDDTLVVVTSDHGENLGEGHLLGHTLSLDDRLLRVPFAWAGPGARVEPGVRSLADVPRLLAGALELPAHPWDEIDRPDGIAIAQSDDLHSLAPEAAEAFADALHLSERARRAASSRRECATDGRFKLVRVDGRASLYDIEADPLELRDALAEHPAEAAGLAAVLDGLPTGPPAGLAAGVPAAEPPAEDDEEEADLEERMRMLGYL